MAKKTLLQMVQSILSDIDGDVVNSISDTVEAEQIVDVLEQTYYDLIANEVIPELKSLFKFTALGDSDRPNYFEIPSDVNKVLTFEYDVKITGDTKPTYKKIKYLEPNCFLDRVMKRNLDDDFIVEITDFSGIKLLIQNNKAPEFYTSFDDRYIVTDSYDSDIDSTLQESKSIGFGVKEPVFARDDDFVPTIDSNLFQLYFNEAKTTVFINQKQQVNPRSAQLARQQRIRYQGNRHKIEKANKPTTPNYGRK